MNRYYDGMKGIRFSLINLFDKDVFRWTFAQIVITLITMAISFAVIIPSSWEVITGDGLIGKELMFVMPLLDIVSTVVEIVSFFVLLYVAIRLMFASMNVVKRKGLAQTPPFLDWLILNFRLIIVNILCLYDMNMLFPAISIFVFSVSMLFLGVMFAYPFFSLAALTFGLPLAIVAWLVAFTIHYLRTRFAAYMLVRGDGKESRLPKRSYDMVLGRTWQVFCAMLVGYLALLLFYVPISFISVFVSVIMLQAGLGIASIVTLIIMILSAWVLSIAFWNIYAADMFYFFCPVKSRKKRAVKKGKKVKKR